MIKVTDQSKCLKRRLASVKSMTRWKLGKRKLVWGENERTIWTLLKGIIYGIFRRCHLHKSKLNWMWHFYAIIIGHATTQWSVTSARGGRRTELFATFVKVWVFWHLSEWKVLFLPLSQSLTCWCFRCRDFQSVLSVESRSVWLRVTAV